MSSAVLLLCLSVFSLSMGAARAEDKPLAERLQSGSSIPNLLARRDPFLRPTNPQAPPPDTRPKGTIVAELPKGVDMSAPELERYNPETYELVAVLLGDVYPRALVRPPNSRKVYVVREKDRLGNRSGKIRNIQEGALVITEETKQSSGAIRAGGSKEFLSRGQKDRRNEIPQFCIGSSTDGLNGLSGRHAHGQEY